jgi:hypothetical protein
VEEGGGGGEEEGVCEIFWIFWEWRGGEEEGGCEIFGGGRNLIHIPMKKNWIKKILTRFDVTFRSFWRVKT